MSRDPYHIVVTHRTGCGTLFFAFIALPALAIAIGLLAGLAIIHGELP